MKLSYLISAFDEKRESILEEFEFQLFLLSKNKLPTSKFLNSLRESLKASLLNRKFPGKMEFLI
jgi:hypothetical protein